MAGRRFAGPPGPSSASTLPAHLVTTAVRRFPFLPADRDLPGAADLLAGSGAGCVARFLDGRGLEPRRVEPAQAHYRPGRWMSICFRATAVDRSSGHPVCLTVTVECRPEEPGCAPAVWAFPDDPALPGLAVAADGRLVRRRLRPTPAAVVVEPLRYRPRRRAVLRYRLLQAGGSETRLGGGKVVFGKVVTPGRGRRLLALADALRHAAGGIRSAGDPGGRAALRLGLPAGRVAPGALVLPSLAGRPLRDLLLAGGLLPPPDRVAALPAELHQRCVPALDRAGLAPAASAAVPGGDRATPRRRFDPCTALAAAQVAARLLPGEGSAAGRLAEAVIGSAEASEPPDEWIVHGDLYENQILLDGDTFGLIDLDDLGPGDPLLDAANFSAHLLLLGASGPPAAAVILRYREELRAAFGRRFDADPADLAWREAYCLLRLVAGPFRVLHPDWPRRMAHRLALATEALSGR